MKATVGVIGLGIMGGAIAKNLADAGWDVVGFDTDLHRQSSIVGQGLQVVSSSAELAQRAEVIITSPPNSPALHATVASIAATVGKKIIIEASTLSLEDKIRGKEELDTLGHVMLDCPLSGTGAQAMTKDLVVYASGDSGTIAALVPLFQGFSRQMYDVGDFGNGSRVKFVANLLVAIHNVASAEAMLLATKAGLDLHRIIELISAGAGTSRVFELRAPLMAERRYQSATMKLSVWQKDMSLIAKFAEHLDCPVPIFSATLPFYASAIAQGHGDHDTAAVFAVMESMTSTNSENPPHSLPPG